MFRVFANYSAWLLRNLKTFFPKWIDITIFCTVHGFIAAMNVCIYSRGVLLTHCKSLKQYFPMTGSVFDKVNLISRINTVQGPNHSLSKQRKIHHFHSAFLQRCQLCADWASTEISHVLNYLILSTRECCLST